MASRSSEPYLTVLSNTNTAAQVRVRVTEFMPVSLFLAYGLSRGLTYLNNLSFTFTFGDLRRIWSHAANGNTISTISATISQGSTAPPTASMTWLQDNSLPNIDVVKYPRLYDYNDLRQWNTAVGTLASGASTVVNVNTVTVGSIPKYIYLFAKQRLADETYLTSDVNCRINSCTFFLNGQPMMTEAQSVDLYQISVKNGNKQTWPQWYKYQGSVLCFAVGSDLQLIDPSDYPGKNKQTTLSAQVSITNPSAESRVYDLQMIAVIPSLCAISAEGGTQLISGFDPSFVKATEMLPNAKQFELMNEPAMIGGGFFDKLWGAVKKVAAPVAQILPAVAAATGNPLAAALGTAANIIGSDSSAVDKASDLYRLAQQARGRGGALMAGAPIGGALIGGRMKKKKRGGCLDCGDDDRPVGHMTNKQLLKQLRI